MKPETDKHNRTAIEELQQWNRLGTLTRKITGGLNQFLSRETSSLHHENMPI